MDKDILAEAKDAFAACEEAESDNRKWALEDLRFARLNEQWDDGVRKKRELEGRPCLTINKMPAFIRQVTNEARQNRPSIKIHPSDSVADPKTAEIMGGLIRNIEYTSNADVAYDTGADFAASGGFGYFRIVTDYSCEDSFDLDILIKRVANPLTVYGDPKSQEADSSDWNTAFVTEMLSRDDFAKRYPKAELSDWQADDGDEKDRQWINEDSIRIAEYWTRSEEEQPLLLLSDGTLIKGDDFLRQKDIFLANGVTIKQERTTKVYKVKQHIITGAEVLETVDWLGKYIPIVPVYGEELNVEGKRYFMSLIRQAKDAQRMFNYWRTAATELVALAPKAPWIGEEGVFTDPNWNTANTDTHAYLEYKRGAQPPQRQPFAGIPAGILQESLNSSDDMKAIMGMYDASLGARSNETSGKAIMARQREGDVSTFHFQDNMTRAIRHAGRILIDLIPKIYTQDRVVRVMGEDGTPQVIPLGKEVPQPDGTTHIYDLTAGKYDLTVTAGPSYTTRRQEAADQMIEMGRAVPQIFQVAGDVLAKNLDWPGADELAKRLEALQQPQQPQTDPKAELEMKKLEAELEKARLQAPVDAAKYEVEKMKIALELRKIEHESQRMAIDATRPVAVA